MATRSCDRNLKPFYPQFLIVCHVAAVNENVCSLRCLLSNERAACFPANKRRFDETNPYCIVALSKVRFLLICKLKTNFSAKSSELCMGCPLTKEHKQKKIQFSPLKLSGTVESVCSRKCVNTKFYLEKRSGIEKSIGRQSCLLTRASISGELTICIPLSFRAEFRRFFVIGHLFTQQITQYSQMLKINLDRFYNTKKFLSFV